jgi:fibronectin-binding autotransporter adhesin
MKTNWHLRYPLALAVSMLLANSFTFAQTTYIWGNSNVTNTSTTLDWFTGGSNTQATWTDGTPLSSNLNTIQFFTNTATAVPNTTTVTLGSNLNNGGNAFQLGTLTLSGQAPTPANQDLTMNLAGDALNFSGASGTINLDSVDISGNSRNITWNVSNAIQLGTASSASTLTLAGSGSSAYNFSGGFTELQAGGGSKLIKSGSSLATLSGAVTVSGGLELNAGTLRLMNASNAITGGITLNGGTLGDNNGRITTQTLNNNLITVNGAASLGMEGGTTTNGGITLNSGANLTLATNASSATVNGDVTGVGSISIGQLGGGSHTQNLNSTANTFTGTISFTAATHAATLNINSLADSASLGAGNIRFVGSAGSNAHTFALGSGAIAPVTLNSRRIEIVSGSAAAYTVNNNSSQAFTINTDLLVGATGARTLTLGGTGTGLSTFGGIIGNGSGTVSISKAGSGTWLFSGDNTYTGTTTVTAGILNMTKAAALPGYNSAAKVVINGGTLGVQVGGSGWTTGQVDTLLTNATKTSGALGIDTTNANLTQWTAFTTTNLGSTLGLTKLGNNTLTLDQSNTFAGALTISQGAVSIGTINNASSAGVLGNSANAVVLGSVGNTGTLLYTGTTASTTKTFTAATSGTGAFNIQEGATNLTLSGLINGSGNITKEGAGILTLGIANSYSGATTVNGGQLRWGISDAIAGGALNINDGGTVNMQTFTDTVGTLTIAKGGSITGTSGALTSGTFISNNGGTMTGATLVLTNNGSVSYNSTGPGSSTFQIEKLSINDAGTNVFNIADGDAAVDFDITGFVNNGGNNVGRTITKTGAGALQFSGSTMGAAGQNSISLNINEGMVLMNRSANTAFVPGGDGTITVGDGVGSSGSAILKFADTGGNEQIGNRPITINSDGLFDLNGKTETISGALTINSGSVITGAGNLTLSGSAVTSMTLGGTASINGTTTFSGAAGAGITATGTTSIAGTVAFGSNGRTIAVNTGSDVLTITANITGSAALTKNGAGTLQIGDGTTAGTLSSTSGLTMGGGTLAILAPASGSSTQTIASLATTASTGSTIRITPGSSGNTTLTITSSTLSTGAGSSVNFNYTAGTTVGDTVGNNYVVWNPTLTGGIIGGAYTVTDTGGTGFATKSGTHIVRLTDSGTAGLPVSTGSATGSYFIGNVYSTSSTTTPGSLVQALSGALAASNLTVNTTGLASGANLALGTNLLTLGAGIVFDGSNAYEITGSGAGGLGAASAGGTINLYNANTNTVTISAPIANNSASRLTIDGPGTTILSGSNAYTGATVLNGGITRFSGTMAASAVTLNNGAVAQLGAATGLTSSNTVTFGAGATGSLQLLGNNLTIGALNSNATLGTPIITNSDAANATLTIDSGSGSTFGGVIQDGAGGGTLALAKSGAGTLTLTGTNTYSGGTTINAGILSVTSDAFLGNASGSVTLNGGRLWTNGANLNTARNITVTGTGSSIVVNRNNNFSTSGTLTGSGSLGFANPGGSGTTSIYNFTSTGNTFTGAMSLDLADVRVSSLGDAAGNNIVFTTTAGSTFSLNSTGVTAGLIFNQRAIELSNVGATVSNNNTTHGITIGSNLVATGAAAKTLTLSAAAGPTNVFSGSIGNGTGGGTVAMTKSGTGTWVLDNSASTYTGQTTISAGNLVVSKMANYGADSSIGKGTSGTSIAMGSAASLVYTGTGDNTDRSIDFTSAGTGASNSVNVVNNGTGALNFTAATFNTGASNSNNRYLTFGGTNGGTISGAIRDTGTGVNPNYGYIQLIKNGSGTWTMAGANNIMADTTLNAGTLKLDYTTNDNSKLGDVSTVGFLRLNGGTLELAGGTHQETVLSTTITNGTTFIKRTGVGATSKLLMGVITYTSGALDFSAAGIANVSTSAVTNGILSSTAGTARVTVGGADWAAKDGSNNVIAYTGYTSFTGGATSANINYSSVGDVTLGANRGATSNTFKITTSGTGQSMKLNSNFNLTLGSLLFAGADNYSIAAESGTGRIDTGFLLHNYGAGTLTLGATNGTITQFGTGKTVLAGNNASNVGINIFGGTVQFSNNLQIGSNTGVQAITLNNGTLLADTSSTDIALNNGGLNSRTVTLGAGGGMLDIIGGGTLAVTGVISDTAGQFPTLTIGSGTSSGTIVLSGANTYTGRTFISGGTLSVGTIGNGGVAGNLGQASSLAYNIVFDGGALAYTGADATSNREFTINAGKTATIETSNNLSLVGATGAATNGALVKSGVGTLTLTGTNTYTGSTTISAGMLAITGTGSINASSGITVASGAHFKYNSSTALTAPLTLSAGSTLSGSGTVSVDLALNSTAQTLAPGNSPGIQTLATTQNWSSFTYEWETNNFIGTTVGTDFDQIAITGDLNLTGNTAGSYVLDILSLTSGNLAGGVPDFAETSRTWNILTTTGSINSFNAAYWTLNTDGFTSDPAWQGDWSIGLNETNNALVLNYSAYVIPEPKAALLGGLGLLLLLRRRR